MQKLSISTKRFNIVFSKCVSYSRQNVQLSNLQTDIESVCLNVSKQHLSVPNLTDFSSAF